MIVEFLLDDKFTATFSILIGLGVLFQVFFQGATSDDVTLQNFIYKDSEDLENVQRNKKKEKKEFIGHHVSSN
jgi:hypothetical protein